MSNVNCLVLVLISLMVFFNCSSIASGSLMIPLNRFVNIAEFTTPSYTVEAGFSFNAVCSRERSEEWLHRSYPFTKELEKPSITYARSGHDLTLHIEAVSSKDVGFYDCIETDSSGYNDTVTFYLFVDDPTNLRVGPRVVRIKHTTYEPAQVPCIPTAPDVEVKLLTSFREPIPFSVDREDENVYIYYDPKRGFIIPGVHLEGFWHTYICEFTKRGVEQEMVVNLIVDTGSKDKIAFLEHQVDSKNEITAVPESTVQFVAEVYANYEPVVSWRNSRGDIVTNSSKYRVERTPGEPSEIKLVIQHVDKGDSGLYSVRMDVPRQSLPYQQITFFLNVRNDYKLDIAMDKVFVISEKIFIADCLVRPPKKRLLSTWTFRPYGCEGNHNCVKEVTSLDKIKPGDVGYVIHSSHSIALHRPDLGNLTCSVVFDDNSTASVTRALIVSEVKEGFQVEFRSHYHSVVLDCNVSRFLYSDNLYWIDAEGSVLTDNTTDLGENNFTLTKSETIYSYRLSLKIHTDLIADLKDKEFRCMAVDYHHVPAFKSLKIKIVNGYAPAISGSSLKNGTQFAEDGSYVYLTCCSSGYPDPTIYWYKNDIQTGEDGQKELAFVANMNDSARYACHVRNHFGSDWAYTDLEIYEPVQISISDTDKKNGWNLREMLWPRVALLCLDGGQTAHNMTWFKDEKPVLESFRIRVKKNGTILSINPLEQKDLGFYSCRSDPRLQNALNTNTGSGFPVAWTVLGTLTSIALLSAVIYLGVRRFWYMRTCKTAFTYRDLLNKDKF